MVFILSKLYSFLPERIKNHPKIIEIVQKFNNNNKFREIESHYKMLDLIFSNYDIKATGTMRQIQLLGLELLKLFDNICKKYEINYWLDYGTLLGAYRHRGFIPWDDDIDISMIREDYNKFLEIFPKEIAQYPQLKENIILSKLTKPHEDYPNNANELDLLNNGTFLLFFQCAYRKPFVHFDVFPKEFIENEGLTTSRNQLQTELQVELRDKIEDNTWTFEEGLEIQNNKMKFTNNKTKQISDAVDGLHNNIHNRIYKTDYVFPLKKIVFENYEFSCPNNCEEYLTLIYGDQFMHIPHIALDHNTTGFVENQYNNIRSEMNNAFDETIKLLQEINNKYS